MFCRQFALPAAVLSISLLYASPAAAQYTWTGGVQYPPPYPAPNWNISSNWDGNGIPPSGPNTTITFTVAPILQSFNNYAGTFTVKTLTFDTAIMLSGGTLGFPSSNAYGTISQGSAAPVTISNNLTVSGGPLYIRGAGSGEVTLSGAITGSGPLAFGFNTIGDGNYNAILNNPSNNYNSGGAYPYSTYIYSLGTLYTAVSGALPAGGSVLIHSGTLDLNGTNQTVGNLQLVDPSQTQTALGPAVVQTGFATLTVNGSVSYSPNVTDYAPGATISGYVDFGANNSTLSIAASSENAGNVAYDTAINATIKGSSGFTKTGNGSLALTETISNTGPVTVSAGYLALGAANILSSAVVVNGGLLSLNAPFTVQGVTAGNYSQSFGSLQGTSGGVSIADATLTIGTNNTSTAYTGNLYSNSDAALIKVGTGSLTLNGDNSAFAGSIIVNGGTLAFFTDFNLGAANSVTVNPAGTLLYDVTTTTTRTFTLNGGTLAAGSGVTLTYNGATVNGGFLRGAGTHALTGGTALNDVTTFNSTTISVIGPASFTNFSNGGALAVAAAGSGTAVIATMNGFVNQGSGSITVGAASMIDSTDFQSYGTLTLNPAVVGAGKVTELVNAGSSPLFFNGGSRTFIGTPGTAIDPNTHQPAFVAGIDLHGQNAVVAGGLFVNNGFVGDSSNGGAGTSTVVADFGSLVKGAGFFQNPVITQNGGKFQAGNSPGSAEFGSFVLGPGGVNNYVFAIDDATGTAGPSPDALGHVSGWGLVQVGAPPVTPGGLTGPGDFTWTATPGDKLTVALDTLINPTTVGTDITGRMADFDPNQPYTWTAVTWAGSYAGPTSAAALDAATTFDVRGFENPIAGSFGWNLDTTDQTLSLSYTPTAVPESGTMALSGLAAIGLVTFWRSRWRSSGQAGTLSTPPLRFWGREPGAVGSG